MVRQRPELAIRRRNRRTGSYRITPRRSFLLHSTGEKTSLPRPMMWRDAERSQMGRSNYTLVGPQSQCEMPVFAGVERRFCSLFTLPGHTTTRVVVVLT
jgi:hypothetical protein